MIEILLDDRVWYHSTPNQPCALALYLTCELHPAANSEAHPHKLRVIDTPRTFIEMVFADNFDGYDLSKLLTGIYRADTTLN